MDDRDRNLVERRVGGFLRQKAEVVRLAVCYQRWGKRICVGEDTWRNFQSLKFQEGFCISQRHASACLKKQDRNQSTPLCPSVYFDYIWRCLPVLQYCSFFIFLSQSCRPLCLLLAFSCYMKISTLSVGRVDGAEKVISHFFYLLLHVIFFLLLCCCLHKPPPSLFVSHFFCCMQISLSLCLTVSCDDTATSDLLLDLRGIVLHVCVCVCWWGWSMPIL